MKIRPSLLALLLISGCVAHAASGPADYEIRMTRKATVGDHYRIVATGTDEKSMTLSVDGQEQPPRGEQFAYELAAACETLALNPQGREQKARLVIEKLVRATGTQSTELLPAGTVVIAERIGETDNFKVGDNPAPPAVAKALETMGVSMARNEGADDDAVFGTKERKKVGDSWPINSETAAADLAKSGVPAKAANVSGTAKLEEVVTPAKEPLLRLTASMVMHGVNPPLPPGLAVQSSEFTATHTGLFPVDVTKRVQQEGSTMSIAVTAGGTKDGKTMALSMTMKTSRETKFIRN